MASDGKRTRGPCGGWHVYVFNQFAICASKACEAGGKCRKCGSADTAPFVAEHVPPGSFHCWKCGHCWRDPISVSQ